MNQSRSAALIGNPSVSRIESTRCIGISDAALGNWSNRQWRSAGRIRSSKNSAVAGFDKSTGPLRSGGPPLAAHHASEAPVRRATSAATVSQETQSGRQGSAERSRRTGSTSVAIRIRTSHTRPDLPRSGQCPARRTPDPATLGSAGRPGTGQMPSLRAGQKRGRSDRQRSYHRGVIGRADSVLAIRNVLGAAADSRAAALKLVGEPGIGKTTLCRLAESLALAAGFLVITAVGMEWESNLELAALSQILAPLADGLEDLAATQAQLLRSVLAAAPPADTDPFALAVAVHSCLVRAADAQPILLILDDIQWLDATSTGVLAFALRRLEADAVATVIARRPEVADPFPASWPELEVGRLSDDDVRRLLEQLRPDLPSVDPGVAVRVGELLAGNPLALEEFAAGLDRAQALGTAPLPEIPILSGRGRLDFGAPILLLPERTRQALVVVVAAGRERALVRPALRELGLEPADLDPAIDAGLLIENDGLQFTHPLRRAAAYQVVPAGVSTPGARDAGWAVRRSRQCPPRLPPGCERADRRVGGGCDGGGRALDRSPRRAGCRGPGVGAGGRSQPGAPPP